MAAYDVGIVNGTVVVPGLGAVRGDVGVRDGRIAALADALAPRDADRVIDARGKLVLPGAVDSHFHIGIYRDLARDAESETRSALAGGVTTVVSYFRTGSQSAQDFTPFAGLRITGWPTHTLLRGAVVFESGRVAGPPSGRYVRRPVGALDGASR